MTIRFSEDDVRAMGRATAGVRGMKLKNAEDAVVGCDVARDGAVMLFVSSSGHGKRTKLDAFNRQGRGGQGVRGMKITASRGAVVAAFTVAPDDEILVFSSGGNIIRMERQGDLGAGSGRHRGAGRPAGSRRDGECRGPGARGRDRGRRGHLRPMGSVADDIGPETAVRPPPRDPARVPASAARPLDGKEATAPPPPAATAAPAARALPVAETERRYRQTIHRVDLWSVLKISVCFYICGMAVTMVALVALWAIADAAGVIHSVEKFIGDLLQTKNFTFLDGEILRGALLVVGGDRRAADRDHGDRGRVLQRVRRALRRHRAHHLRGRIRVVVTGSERRPFATLSGSPGL